MSLNIKSYKNDQYYITHLLINFWYEKKISSFLNKNNKTNNKQDYFSLNKKKG